MRIALERTPKSKWQAHTEFSLKGGGSQGGGGGLRGAVGGTPPLPPEKPELLEAPNSFFGLN